MGGAVAEVLESLTLHGFKSFADRAALEFGPGITAVIGPNGSGKSNVVEALRWVTHQARARELRAGRPGELIFHGSGAAGVRAGGRAPLGLAEVQLELRGPGGGRLRLGRRLYRDGSGEQDLDGKSARVREVQGALRGSGLGTGGLAVIGQGEVGGVVQAEGRVLLGYLQEAAGLSGSVAARQQTVARLLDADADLSRLRLLEDELAGRVERLARAEAAAADHQRLSLRRLALEQAQVRARFEAATRDLAAGREKLAALEAGSGPLGQALQDSQALQEQLRDAVRRARERGLEQRGALELLQAAEAAQRQAGAYLVHLAGEAGTLSSELRRLLLEPPAHPDPAAAPDGLPSPAAPEAARLRAATHARRAQELEAQLARARQAAARRAELWARSSAQAETLAREAGHLRAALEAVRAELEQARARHAPLLAAREEAERLQLVHAQQQAGQQERRRQLDAQLGHARAEAAPLTRERTRLAAALDSYTRYGEGPRNALRSNHPGIAGSVADLLSVPAEYEAAVTAALGRRLEQVVVGTADDAREIIETLRRQGGRATFLPLDLLRVRPRRGGELLREPGVLGNLADLCPSDPASVGQSLLGDTLLLQDLTAATALARRRAERPRLVTLDGELIEPGGALTGGRLRDGGAGVLADQRRLSELDDELAALDTRAAQLLEELEHVQAPAAAPDPQRRSQLIREEEAARRALESARARHEGLARQLEALEARSRPRPAEPDPAVPDSANPTNPAADPAALEAELIGVRGAADLALAEERRLGAGLQQAREWAAAWNTHRAALARAQVLRARLEAQQVAHTAQQRVAADAGQEVQRRRAALGELDPQALGRAEQALGAEAQRHTTLLGRQNRLRAELDELRLSLARREGSLGTVPDGAQLPGSPREWAAELTRLEGELARLGSVNPAAAEERALEGARLGTLRAERTDAEDASAELRAHLAELETAEDAAARAAHGRVAAAFARYSGELLGGLGELEAELDPAGRLGGLRLGVQPAGKRTRSLNLLSAGERTMAGLAFLFALSEAAGEPGTGETGAGEAGGRRGGLPLAVLDEVDAPLDEANIRRFTRFLTLLAAQGSQFVVVTHQKATMEVAQALWGVTTDASGASRVLSIRRAGEA